MKTIQELVEHMKRHNDAVFIVGPGIGVTPAEKPTTEELEECYTAKALRREPEKFWAFFRKYIFVNPDVVGATPGMYSIQEMNKKGLISTIATQNTDGLFIELGMADNVIHLHGHTYLYSAGGKEMHTAYSVAEQDTVVPVGDNGKALRPRVLLHGESYKQEDYDALRLALLNTHTLVIVGLDFSEEPIMQLIADYVEMKDTANPLSEDFQKKAVVAIGHAPYDLNKEIGHFEFIVNDSPSAALERLQNALV